MTAPALPRPLARRIDRLARAGHGFHRFAHHPLCGAYAGEVLRFGRMRVCRGCTLAAAGAALGVLGGLALPFAGLAELAVLALLAGLPALASLRWRPGKALTRLLPAGAAAFAAVQGLLRQDPAGLALALAVLAGILAGLVLYCRRGPARGACATCPAQAERPACPGYAPILRRERAVRRLAGRWIDHEPALSPNRFTPAAAPPR